MTIWRLRIACWIPKATNTHLAYVVLTAFPMQLVARTRLSVMLYVRCLSCYIYYTQLHVSAIYPGDLQGVTDLFEVYSVYGNVSKTVDRDFL